MFSSEIITLINAIY